MNKSPVRTATLFCSQRRGYFCEIRNRRGALLHVTGSFPAKADAVAAAKRWLVERKGTVPGG